MLLLSFSLFLFLSFFFSFARVSRPVYTRDESDMWIKKKKREIKLRGFFGYIRDSLCSLCLGKGIGCLNERETEIRFVLPVLCVYGGSVRFDQKLNHPRWS